MKKIGIVGWSTGDNSFGITKPYYEFINFFDAEPVILSPSKDIKTDLDMLIIPGGPDVDPTRYNEIPSIYTSKICPQREYFDRVLLPKYIDLGIGIFGICRGLQGTAVHFGAKLDQHIWQEYSDPRTKEVHNLRFTKRIHFNYNLGETNYTKTFNPGQRISINSIHHQAVNADSISTESEIMVAGVRSSLNNKINIESNANVELILHKTKPIILVQWHPEEVYDEFSIEAVYTLLNKGTIRYE